MLNRESVNAAMQVAMNVTGSGCRLEPVAASPLALAVGAMQPISLEGNIVDAVLESARPALSGFDQHTGEIRACAEMLYQRLTGNIRFAKATINPLCREIIEACQETKQLIENQSPLNVNIRMFKTPGIFNASELDAKLERYKDGKFPEISLSGDLLQLLDDSRTEEIILGAVKNNTASWDASIDEILTIAKSQDYPIKGMLFSKPEYKPGSAGVMVDMVSCVNFLFLDALLSGKVETFSLSDITVQQRAELSKMLAYYGSMTYRQINNILNMHKTKRFMFMSDQYGQRNEIEVCVYERGYREWVSQGGSAEALIAAMATFKGPSPTAEVALLADPDQYNKKYLRLEGLYRDRQRIDVTSKLQDVVYSKIFGYIHGELDEGQKAEAVANAKCFFEKEKLQNNGHIDNYVRKCVCRTLAPKTSIESILNDMDYYIESHEDATFSAALTFAFGVLLGKHAANQVRVVECAVGHPTSALSSI